MAALIIVIIITAIVLAMRISKVVAKILAEPIVRIQEATGQLELGNRSEEHTSELQSH